MQFMMTRVDMTAQMPLTTENKIVLALVESFFVDERLPVKKSLMVNGFSGVEYPVDILASIPDSKSSNVILRVMDKEHLTIDDVLKTHVMSFDSGSEACNNPFCFRCLRGDIKTRRLLPHFDLWRARFGKRREQHVCFVQTLDFRVYKLHLFDFHGCCAAWIIVRLYPRSYQTSSRQESNYSC